MKNILKYAGAFLASLAVFTACEGFEDHIITIDAPPRLAYVNPALNTYTTKITHTPIGTTSPGLDVEFGVFSNTSSHETTTVSFAIDNTLIEGYNSQHGTSYVPLPSGYMSYENLNLVIPADSLISTDSVRMYLSGDVSALTEEGGYLVPLRMTAEGGLETAPVNHVVYAVIDTEYTLMRSNPSASDITGTLVSDRSAWDFAGNTNMFDGSTSTYTAEFALDTENVIALGTNYSINALRFYARNAIYGTNYRPTTYTIQYSTDNVNWSDIGTATSSNILVQSSYQIIVLYGTVTARYLRITPSGGSSYTGMAEFDIYAE